MRRIYRHPHFWARGTIQLGLATLLRPQAQLSAGIDSLTIRGRFPHARCMSFTTYTGQTQAIDGINDVHVVPATGSIADNPFIADHARNTDGAVRDYVVTVVKRQKPATPAPNTVYLTDANGTHSNLFSFLVIYGTYRPDKAFPNDGGGGGSCTTMS